MIKMLHVVAIGALVSSALYAYSIKYDTTLAAEELQKLRKKVAKEHETIAVLKAEWQYLNRPDRIQTLSDRHLDLQPLAITQIVRLGDVPALGPRQDAIGRKLEDLFGSTETPASATPANRTPVATRTGARP